MSVYPSIWKLASNPAVASQNVTNKNCLLCFESENIHFRSPLDHWDPWDQTQSSGRSLNCHHPHCCGEAKSGYLYIVPQLGCTYGANTYFLFNYKTILQYFINYPVSVISKFCGPSRILKCSKHLIKRYLKIMRLPWLIIGKILPC